MIAKSPGVSTRREELLGAAEQLLITNGPHALSLRTIAERCGLTTQAVYTEFGGKPGLADALYREGYRRLAARLAAVPADLDPIDRIRALTHAYRDTAFGNPHFYELMTGRPLPEYDPPIESRQEAAATFQTAIDAVETATQAGLLEAESSREVADMLWAAGHGYLSLVIQGLQQVDPERWDRLFDAIIDAYRPRP